MLSQPCSDLLSEPRPSSYFVLHHGSVEFLTRGLIDANPSKPVEEVFPDVGMAQTCELRELSTAYSRAAVDDGIHDLDRCWATSRLRARDKRRGYLLQLKGKVKDAIADRRQYSGHDTPRDDMLGANQDLHSVADLEPITKHELSPSNSVRWTRDT